MSISVLIPSLGRPSLERTLRSIEQQGLEPGDEVLVIGDRHQDLPSNLRDRVLSRGPHMRYFEHDAGFSHYGCPQVDYAMQFARGDYLLNQSDDDIYTPGAFARIRAQIAALPEPRPILFRFISPWRSVLWWRKQLARGWVSGQCFAAPNVPSKLGTYDCARFEADYEFIAGTVQNFGGEDSIIWNPAVIVLTRPES